MAGRLVAGRLVAGRLVATSLGVGVAAAAIAVSPVRVGADEWARAAVVVGVVPGTATDLALDLGGARTVAPSTYALEVPAGALDDLARSGDVRWVEPDAEVHAADLPADALPTDALPTDALPTDALPTDERVEEQWYLDRIGLREAWGRTHGSGDVVVAVLDTTVDTSHPDLAGKLLPGSDEVSEECGPGTATAHHGTAVSGLIGAATGNGLGVAGVGWDTRVLPVRVLCDDGSGRSSDVAAGIRAAVDGGARVINLSLTSPTASRAVAEAVDYAHDRGVVLIAAAGNAGSPTPAYPAAFPGVIGVAATTRDDELASFSNRGVWVDLAAPGVDVLAPVPGGGYSPLTGTSFSAPLVSGTAGLLLAAYPWLTAEGLRSRLVTLARVIPATGAGVEWGRLDAGAAVTAPARGYWVATTAGEVTAFGDAGSGNPGSGGPPSVAIAASPTGRGYWVAAADGTVTAFGDAPVLGSVTGPLRAPVVAMAASPSGRGYWLAAADGGVFSFGDAGFFGSLPGSVGRLNEPVVAMAASPSGRGYWLAAADGGVFALGDAGFHGSLGGSALAAPITAMAATALGGGYVLVSSTGEIDVFGDAPHLGDLAGWAATRVVGLALA